VARGREAVAVQQVGRCELQQPAGKEEVEAKSQGGVSGVRQQGQRDNQLTNKRQTGGEAYKRQTGNMR
jgi:hypothetical protein